MKRLVQIIILFCLLISCGEEIRKSKLDIPEVSILKSDTIIPKVAIPAIRKQKDKHHKNLTYWDKYNLKQLEVTSVSDETIIGLTQDDFEFSFDIDSCFFFDGSLEKSHLLLKGKIKNITAHTLFFQAHSCNGLDYYLKSNGNFNPSPFILCNASVPIIEILKSNETYSFQTRIEIVGISKKINPSLLLKLISADNVKIKEIEPLREIELKSESKIIPEKFHYIFQDYSNN